jgi:hypothetical protein
MGVDKLFQAFSAKVEELLPVLLLLLFLQLVLALCDLEFALPLQGNQTYSEIGSA